VKSGRDDGFSRLFETYSGPLRRLCAAYLEDPSDRQDLFQEIAMALEAVRQLEPADRHLAVLYLEGLTGREMADVTGLTENHIGVKLTRLRQKLAVILHGKGVQS
jgi:DNA-directed RNA polymerase specialized sigma24 family protein